MDSCCDRPDNVAFWRNMEDFWTWPRKVVECCKQSLIGHSSMNLEDSGAENYVD